MFVLGFPLVKCNVAYVVQYHSIRFMCSNTLSVAIKQYFSFNIESGVILTIVKSPD